MVAKPGNHLDWVPSGLSTYIQPPTVGQQATGWVFGQAPPFEYMNWLFYYTDQWIQYFDQVLTPGAAGLTANPVVLITTGTITLNSDQVTGLAVTTDIQPGQVVTGTGIAANTLVQAINGTTVQLSKVATATLAVDPLTFSHQFATGGNIQRQLDQLDAAININRAYDIVVGSGPGSTHTTLAEAVADANYGTNQRVLITASATPASTIVLSKAGWRITMAPGVSYTAGAATGIQISANAVELYNWRMVGYTTAVQFLIGGTYGRVMTTWFNTCTTEIDDSAAPAGKKPVTLANITE